MDEDLSFLLEEDKENSTTHQHDAQIISWKTAQTKQEKRRSGGLLSEVPPLSPMKRSDCEMNIDEPDFKSPSAKRRSLHGPSSALDFSIFESDDAKDTERRSRDDHDWFRNMPMSPASRFQTIPRRSSSLRKSTLQQRQGDRSSPLRLNNFSDLRQNWSDATPNAKKPSRISVNFPVDPRESPFQNHADLLNASIHPMVSTSDHGSQPSVVKHPLAMTMTQPASGASVEDDSPTHEPPRRSERSRSHDFSKSLPLNALRPQEAFGSQSSQQSSQGSFATPAAYKAAKPLPAAFLSTGLISKKNRNANDADAGLPKAHMPDTPCKRQTMMFPPSKDKFKPTSAAIRNIQASTGTPKSPADVPFGVNRNTPLPWAKSAGLFSTRAKQNLAKKASFASLVSIEADDKPRSQSPSIPTDSQSTENEYPPTPTRPNGILEARPASISPSPQHMAPTADPSMTSQVSKYATLSPHLNKLDRSSPHTPSDAVFPVDPSSLSISGKYDRPTTRHGNDHFAIPATPTGPREYFGNFSNRPSLNLNAPEVADGDPSLSSKFDKVDLVGTGEFSQVYRVSEPPLPSPFHKSFVSSRPSSRGSLPDKVWAVKKSRHPYSGPKDRARKVHEVDVLKALGQNDHIITYVDSWENRGHLYIQTEFCEEGTLDVFLAQAGVKARLDDFRIWKILLEVSLGLQHIHAAGFIHLDLKPANILITFEGVLKIGDFGMATKWPAKPGIDGEGDREYIGPEILMGRYDKPADIFALGLITLETAGNVELPDNGTSWQKLRNGDLSDVPSLTFSSEDSNVLRDASGNPVDNVDDPDDVPVVHASHEDIVQESQVSQKPHRIRHGELPQPPSFMSNPNDPEALDHLVRWMISPNPDGRPRIDQVLRSTGVQWVEHRRRAGATIFEGNWGPADEVLAEDAEMIDV